MKPEKMADESLRNLLHSMAQTWSAKAADDIRAYIAAIKAERDEARRIHAANVEAGIELAKEFNRVGGVGHEVDGVFHRARALLAEVNDLRAKWATAETELNAVQRQANEAERDRDALREQLAKMTAELAEERQASGILLKKRDAIRERVRALTTEQEKWVRRDKELGERVRALEADLAAIRREDAAVTRRRGMLMGDVPIPTPDSTTAGWRDAFRESHKLHQHWARRAEAAESSLAALRERVKALEAEVGNEKSWSAGVQRAAKENMQRLESRLAAIRQRAGSEEAMQIGREAYDRAIAAREHSPAAFELGLRAFARYILGDESECPQAKPCDPETPGVYECPVGCACRCHARTPQAHERCEDRTCGCHAQERDAKPEPTTAEAFAIQREALAHQPYCVCNACRNLSLLERRMGAMGRALNETLKLHHRMPGDVIAQIQAALTDAPPVFTLEELEAEATTLVGRPAFDGVVYVSGWNDALSALLERLGAMRK